MKIFRNLFPPYSDQRLLLCLRERYLLSFLRDIHICGVACPVSPWVLASQSVASADEEAASTHLGAADSLRLSTFSIWSLQRAVYPAPPQGGIHDSHDCNWPYDTFGPGCHLTPFLFRRTMPLTPSCTLRGQEDNSALSSPRTSNCLWPPALPKSGGSVELLPQFPNCKKGKQGTGTFQYSTFMWTLRLRL